LLVTDEHSQAALPQIVIADRRQNLSCNANALSRSTAMMDAVMMAIGFGFFALSIAYVYACDRL